MPRPARPTRPLIILALLSGQLTGAMLTACHAPPAELNCAPACDSPWTFTVTCQPLEPMDGAFRWTGFLARDVAAPVEVHPDSAFAVTLTGTYNTLFVIAGFRCTARVDEVAREVLLLPELRLQDRRDSGTGLMETRYLHCLVDPLPAAGGWVIRYSPDVQFLTGPPSPSVLDSLPRTTVLVTPEAP